MHLLFGKISANQIKLSKTWISRLVFFYGLLKTFCKDFISNHQFYGFMNLSKFMPCCPFSILILKKCKYKFFVTKPLGV